MGTHVTPTAPERCAAMTISQSRERYCLAREIARNLRPGDVLALEGDGRGRDGGTGDIRTLVCRRKVKEGMWLFLDRLGRYETLTFSQIFDNIPWAPGKMRKWLRRVRVKGLEADPELYRRKIQANLIATLEGGKRWNWSAGKAAREYAAGNPDLKGYILVKGQNRRHEKQDYFYAISCGRVVAVSERMVLLAPDEYPLDLVDFLQTGVIRKGYHAV